MTMRYFTPERYIQLQGIHDAQSFTTAYEAWERALAEYRAHLAHIESLLPVELRQFATRECLHDATLLASWMEDLRLNLLLRPEDAREHFVLLVYDLVDPPWIDQSAFPSDYGSPQMSWLYDEVEVEGETPPAESPSDVVFTHTVLFSNGWEMRLRFKRFRYSRPEMIVEPTVGALRN